MRRNKVAASKVASDDDNGAERSEAEELSSASERSERCELLTFKKAVLSKSNAMKLQRAKCASERRCRSVANEVSEAKAMLLG